MFNSYKEINLNWLKLNTQKIHFFGLGFIQIKINDEYRLHFYHKDLPAFVETPHTHRYDFTSTILKGNFTQNIYEVTKIVSNNQQHNYIEVFESCGRGELSEALINYKKPVDCKLILINNYTEGSSYTLDKNTYHTVNANDCITLLRRDNERLEYAKVLNEINKPNICPFSMKIEENELWNKIESMLSE